MQPRLLKSFPPQPRLLGVTAVLCWHQQVGGVRSHSRLGADRKARLTHRAAHTQPGLTPSAYNQPRPAHLFSTGVVSESDMEGFSCSWGELSSRTLRRYLEEQVRISRAENSEVLEKVIPELERILKGVAAADPRFGSAYQRAGSYKEGLKVSEPDEFDFLVPLKLVPKLSLSSESVYLPEAPRNPSVVPVMLSNRAVIVSSEQDADLALWQQQKVSVPLVASMGHSMYPAYPVRNLLNVYTPPRSACNETKCLMCPEKMMDLFKKLVGDVLKQKPGKVNVERKRKGSPAVTFTIPCQDMEISVDLVPIIKNPFIEWDLPWPRPGARWPSQSKIEEIKKIGVDLVAKRNMFWRYSFSRIEPELIESIDEDGGQRRNSLRILKKIKEDVWKPKFGNALTSYHLKNLWFWACEEYPDKEQWQDLAESFKRLVDKLLHFLSCGALPHYFMGDKVNLFKAEKKVLDDVYLEILQFKYSPMTYCE